MQARISFDELKDSDIQNKFPANSLSVNSVADILKSCQGLTLISAAEAEARFQYTKIICKQSIKFHVQLLKKLNFVLKCYNNISKFEDKLIERKLPELLCKLNKKIESRIFLYKVVYDRQNRSIVVETVTTIQSLGGLGAKDIQMRFMNTINESFQLLQHTQELITVKKVHYQDSIKGALAKLKEQFEQSRMIRAKATKICLLSNHNFPVGKIVSIQERDTQDGSRKLRQLAKKHREFIQKLLKKDNQMREQLTSRIRQQRDDQEQAQPPIRDHIPAANPKKTPILKPICIFKMQSIQKLNPGGNAQVQKVKCLYQQQDTITSDNQSHIEKVRNEQLIKTEREKVSEVLVRKTPNQHQDSIDAFSVQQNCLVFLRNEQCPQIAQYYKISKKQGSYTQQQSKRELYSKFYEKSLQHAKKASVDTRVRLMVDLMEGIMFLLRHEIVHRDLKFNNIQLGSKFRVKIIDFGSAFLTYGNENLVPSLKKFSNRYPFTKEFLLSYKDAKGSYFSIDEYYQHRFFDIYAYGVIVSKLFGASFGDHDLISDNLQYIRDKCMQRNPEDRLSPEEVIKYLQILAKSLNIISQI